MPKKDRWGVVLYEKGEDPPPKPWYMSREERSGTVEDMPYWQVWFRGAVLLVLVALVVAILMVVGTWWDENTYGYSDCVEDGMADNFAEYGPSVAHQFRPMVEDDCDAQYRR